MRAVKELIKTEDIDLRRYEDELRNPDTDLSLFLKNLAI